LIKILIIHHLFNFNGDITYIIGSSNINIGNISYYLTEIENKLTVLDGYCFVKCSDFFSTFENIIKKSLIQNTSTNSISNSNDLDLVKQLKQLNDLYESGVITKEEFQKAKKRILN